MAHVILFADRSPEHKHRFGSKLNSVRYTYSAGPYKVASTLRKEGFDVLVVSSCLNLSFAGIKKIILKNKDNLLWVGISTTLMQTACKSYGSYRNNWFTSKDDFADPTKMFKTSYDYKNVNFEIPWGSTEIFYLSSFLEEMNIPLILGGSHVTKNMNGGLRRKHNNTYFVKGNAEEWVKIYTINKKINKDFEPPLFVPNNHYDDNEFKNSQILWDENDLIDKDDWLPIEVARGCAFNCAYCSYEHKGKFELYKHPAVLRDELTRNYEKFGIRKYLLVDDLYNDSKEKVRELYDKVWNKLPFKVEWTSYLRLDMFWSDPESIEIVRESGCRAGTFGIETLHSKAGRRVGKGLGKERILETLENLKRIWKDNVLVHAHFIAGLPDEPLESIQETLEWTITTDLLHSVGWMPLFISPPSLLPSKSNTSKMDDNSEKYEFTWKDNTWTNNVNVSFDMADQLIAESFKERYKRYRVHFGNYCDLRTLGLTHQQVIDITRMPVDSPMAENTFDRLGDILENKVKDRLLKFLNV